MSRESSFDSCGQMRSFAITSVDVSTGVLPDAEEVPVFNMRIEVHLSVAENVDDDKARKIESSLHVFSEEGYLYDARIDTDTEFWFDGDATEDVIRHYLNNIGQTCALELTRASLEELTAKFPYGPTKVKRIQNSDLFANIQD